MYLAFGLRCLAFVFARRLHFFLMAATNRGATLGHKSLRDPEGPPAQVSYGRITVDQIRQNRTNAEGRSSQHNLIGMRQRRTYRRPRCLYKLSALLALQK